MTSTSRKKLHFCSLCSLARNLAEDWWSSSAWAGVRLKSCVKSPPACSKITWKGVLFEFELVTIYSAGVDRRWEGGWDGERKRTDSADRIDRWFYGPQQVLVHRFDLTSSKNQIQSRITERYASEGTYNKSTPISRIDSENTLNTLRKDGLPLDVF